MDDASKVVGAASGLLGQTSGLLRQMVTMVGWLVLLVGSVRLLVVPPTAFTIELLLTPGVGAVAVLQGLIRRSGHSDHPDDSGTAIDGCGKPDHG
ncbi:hypothetical protein [Thermostaphylospora chromogena]|uniref:hypothetical protein n=1 Tax=Thermostaphylospora chromogena TaxID=35622 RepID=UPI000B8063D1|nr:hypothetical protein [Thermostaphylospora chromogena]